MTWRAFRKWAGFPIWEDIPVCEHGFKMNLGEWPVYDWVCDHDPQRVTLCDPPRVPNSQTGPVE